MPKAERLSENGQLAEKKSFVTNFETLSRVHYPVKTLLWNNC